MPIKYNLWPAVGPPHYAPPLTSPWPLTFWHWKWHPSHVWRGLLKTVSTSLLSSANWVTYCSNIFAIPTSISLMNIRNNKGPNNVCNFLWRSVKGLGRGEASNFPFSHCLASSSLQHSHYRASVWFITAGRCVFQVHASVAVVTYGEIYTGRRDSALIQVATRRSFGEWRQQTPTVKQCHRCLIPTGIQDNRIITGRQSHAWICGVDIPTRGMISPAAPPFVPSANLIYSHCCKVFYRVTLCVSAVLAVGRCLSVCLSVTLHSCIASKRPKNEDNRYS